MKKELRPEIVMPTCADTTRFAAVAIGFALLGAGLGMLAVDPTSVLVVPSEPAVESPPVSVAVMPAVEEVAPRVAATGPRARELLLMFQVDGSSYVKLADIAGEEPGDDAAHRGEDMPAHGAVALYHEDGRYSAVAPVQDVDLPAAQSLWLVRGLIVDGGCRARVVGFAVVSRLVGETSYAGIKDARWTAATVFAKGERALAARLDGCPNGTFARDAALPGVVVPDELEDDALAAAARELLIDSAPSRETQAVWRDGGNEGLWHTHSELVTRVLRDPETGATFVSVHGRADHECGGPSVNVWGLFRVGPTGKLTAVQLRALGEVESIEHLIDVDGDGELELIGKPFPGLDVIATRADGTELSRLALTLYGCPC